MQRYRRAKFRTYLTPGKRRPGFSLLEMMIVICVLMVMGGISSLRVQPALKDARANTGFRNVP